MKIQWENISGNKYICMHSTNIYSTYDIMKISVVWRNALEGVSGKSIIGTKNVIEEFNK